MMLFKKKMTAFFALCLGTTVAFSHSANAATKIVVTPIKNMVFTTPVRDRSTGGKWVIDFGTTQTSLVKVAPKMEHHTLHRYSKAVHVFVLYGELNYFDAAKNKIVARAGNEVYIPANTLYSASSGPGAIVLLVGSHPNKKIY